MYSDTNSHGIHLLYHTNLRGFSLERLGDESQIVTPSAFHCSSVLMESVHTAEHTAQCYFSCAAKVAQPGQQHKSNWELVLMLPSGKQVRSRASSGCAELQINWQAQAQDHHHSSRSHTEQKQCLRQEKHLFKEK